eukprot:g1513.t1
MAVVLHCKESEETLLQNVLKTRPELLEFYNNAEAAIEKYLEASQELPEPPAEEKPLTKPGRAQPHISTTPKNKAKKRKPSPKSGSRRLSLRGFFTGGSKRRKSSLAMSGTGLRNAEWTIENINEALINDDHTYEVQVPIRLLDGQVDRVTCSSRSTIGDVLRDVLNVHRISISKPEDMLAIYECHYGMEPRRCANDEFILGIVVRWEAKQDHIDDDDVTFILKRWNYKPADAIETLSEKADNIMDSTLRLTYVDLTEHILNGDYTIDEEHIPRFAATKLFFENDCKTDKKFLKQLKKKVKESFDKLVPGNRTKSGRNKKEIKSLIVEIMEAYEDFIGVNNKVQLMHEFINDYKILTKNEYGSAFFRIRYTFSQEATIISNGRIGVNWNGITMRAAALMIPYSSMTSITFGSDKSLLINFEEGKLLHIMPKEENLGIYNLMMEYKKYSEGIDDNIRTPSKRRASMADAMQRYTVKTTADSIMDDMAEAFGDWDFGPDEIDEPDTNDYVQSDESTSNDHSKKDLEGSRDIISGEANKESWEALVDPNSDRVYYHNSDTGETKWDIAASKEYIVQKDQSSGKAYFIHKKTKRTSWVIANVPESGVSSRTARALSNVIE